MNNNIFCTHKNKFLLSVFTKWLFFYYCYAISLRLEREILKLAGKGNRKVSVVKVNERNETILKCEVNGTKDTFHSPNSSRSKKLLTSSAASSLEVIKENTNYLSRNVRKCNVSNGWPSDLTI